MVGAHSHESIVRIRRARVLDAKQLAELSGQLGYAATAKQITRRLARIEPDNRHAAYVAEQSGAPKPKIVGWIHIFLSQLLEEEAQAEIGGLVVDETLRSRGIGRRLMEEAERWARRKGCRVVRLRSNVIRTRAHGFYKRLGYEVIKTQKVFRKRL